MPDNKKIDLSVFDEAVKTTPTKTKEPEIDLSVFDEEVKKKDVVVPVQGAAAKAVSVSPSSKGGESVSAPLDEAQTAQVDQPTYMQQQLKEKGLIVDEPKPEQKYFEKEKETVLKGIQAPEERKVVSSALDKTNRYFADMGGKTPYQKMEEFSEKAKQISEKHKPKSFVDLTEQDVTKIEQDYKNEVHKLAVDLGLEIDQEGKVSPYQDERALYERKLADNIALATKENKKEVGFFENLANKLASGYESAAGNAIDMLGTATGLNYFDGFKDLSKGNKYRADQFSAQANKYDGTIEDYLKAGDVGKAAGLAFSSAVESLPAMIPAFVNPASGVYVMGAMSGIDKYRQIESADIPEWKKVYNAFITGASEAAGEKLVTMPILARSKQALLSLGEKKGAEAIKNAVKKSVDNSASKLGAMPEWVSEGLSEVATGLSTDLVDKVTINPDIEIGAHAVDDFAVGAVMGKVFSLPQDVAKAMDYKAARDFSKNVIDKLPADMDIETKIDVGWKIAERDKLVEAEDKLDEKFKGKYMPRIAALNTEIEKAAAKYAEPKKDEVPVPDAKVDQEPVKEDQNKVDYLQEQGVKIPDGTTMEQLDVLYNETKAKEEKQTAAKQTKTKVVGEAIVEDKQQKQEPVVVEPTTLEKTDEEIAKTYGAKTKNVSTDIIDKIPRGSANEDITVAKEKIQKDGFVEPIVVTYNVKDNTTVLSDGHHRLAAAKELGIKNIPVKVNVSWTGELKYSDIKFNEENATAPQAIDVEKYKKENYAPSVVSPEEIGLIKPTQTKPIGVVSEAVEPQTKQKGVVVPSETKVAENQQKEVVVEPTVSFPKPPKQVKDLSSKEIRQFSDDVKKFEDDLVDNVFGENAAEYKRLERISNSSTRPYDQVKEADDVMEKMIESLPKSKQDLWNSEATHDWRALRETSRLVEYVEQAEGIEDLSSSLKKPLMTFKKDSNNEQSWAIFNAATKRAQELGISPKDLIAKTASKIAREFPDPQDAMDVVKSALEAILQTSEVKQEQQKAIEQQQKQPLVGEQTEVTQLKEKQNGKENGQGRQGLQVEEARKKLERETKIEENKARLGRIFDNAAILTRTRSDITGEERKKVAKELARDVVDYVRTEFDLLGEALIDKVKSFVKENNIPLEDISDSDLNDVVKEKGYAKGTRGTTEKAGVKKEVVKGEEERLRVRSDAKDGVEAGEGKVKQRGFQTGSMEKAGGRFAEIAKEHPLFYTEKTENQQLKDAADWLDGKSEDAIMSALTTGKSGTPEQRVNRKTLYAMYLQDKLNDFVEKGMDEDANATDEALIKITDSLANEGTEIARGLQAYAKYQRMNPNTVTWTINNRIKKENRTKFPEADIEAVADSEEDIKRMAKDLSQESLDDKRLTDIIDNIAKKNKDKKQQTYSEKAKEIADKVRKIKPSSWGFTFSDPLLAASAFDVALETTAKAIEISGNIADSIVKGINAIKRTDWYKGLTNDQKRKAERVFEVNVKKDLGVDGLSKEQLAKYLKTEMKDLGLSLREVIKKHWTDPSSLGVTLSERIVSDLGLTQKEADLVQSTINEIIKEKLADKIDNYIFNESLPKGKAQKEIFINKMGEFLMMGNIDHQYFREAFANKFGLTPTLTKDQAKLISDLNKAVVATKDMGVFGDMAANEFAREIDKLLPKTKAEELFNGMFGLDYANALSGATTHYVNIKSVFFNLLARPFMDITRTEDWIDAIRHGNIAELPILNALNSWIDFASSMGHGTTDFQDIMKSGDLRAMHKYISEVKSIAHLNVPELERHKTGGDRFKPIKAKVGGKEIDLNIANYMKFVGRALAAEDAFSYRGFEAVELATALRKKLRKQGLSESEIKKHIAKQVYGSELSQAELSDVEKQLEKEKEAMELFGFKTDKLKENRRRLEIVREKMLDFTEEELVNLKEVAKGNVFNDTRGGVVNSVMSALSHFANKNVFTKLLTMPHFMFFRIAGNIGDFMIDTIPGYGQARAKGWSPTTMYATYMKHKEDGMAGDKAAFKALAGERLSVSELPFKTAQLGDKGSFRQKQQMDRARIANMMMLSQIAIVAGLYAIGGDDKDENGESWFDISGGRFFDKDIYARDTKLMPTYTVKMGKWKWKYGNSPIMTFGLSVLGNYSDMVKAGKSEQEITDRLKLMTRSFMYSVGALTDQQLMQGFKSMMESGVNLVKTAQSLKAEEADQGDNPVNKVASNFAKYIAKEQLSPLTGWLPTKNNLFQQSLQSYTGTAVESKDIPAMLAYDLGIHHFTNRPALDALGNEVKRKPGYTGIYYEPAMITEDPKKWEMVRWLEQNNAYPATYYNKDERYIYAQPKSKGWFHDVFNEKKPSYEKKQPTEEEFWQMRKLSGEMIQRDLMQYKDATYDGKKIWELEAKEKTSSGKTMMQDKVADYISKAKEQTRLYLFTWGELGKTDKELYDKLYRSKLLPKYETSVNVYRRTDEGKLYKDENGKDVILDRKPLMDEELSAYNRESFIAYMNSMKASKDKIGDEFKDASELAWTNATKEAAKPLGGKATGKPKRSASDILSKAR